jgi:hypothetical protein
LRTVRGGLPEFHDITARIFSSWPVGRRAGPRELSKSCARGSPVAGVVLASWPCEHPVLRTVVFSIAFALAIGPSAAPVCRILCDTPAAAATGCHHDTPVTSTSVLGDQLCGMIAPGAAGFLREEPRLGVFAPDVQHGLRVAGSHLAHVTNVPRPGHATEHGWSLEKLPLQTVLRL